MKISEYLYYKIRPNHIPKKYDDIMKLLAKLERKERIEQDKIKAIKRIRELRKIQRERRKKPSDSSIFVRCDYCNELVIDGEGHEC